MLAHHFLRTIWTALGGAEADLDRVSFEGTGDLPSVFPVSDLAAGSIAAAALAVGQFTGTVSPVRVDRRIASLWFGTSLQPIGWETPPVWDPIAGDYEAADGWIRLHTNAPHHRQAALSVLGAAADREAVAAAVRIWSAEALEHAVVDRGGCAAAMRPVREWAAHPQGMAVAAEPLAWVERHQGTPRQARDPQRPLAGLRVLDLTRILAGPVATRFLAGFGAEVLRIDPPDWEEPSLAPDVTLGKRCARLDLRAQRDRLLALLADADVIVHGYRPGALDRLGLDAKTRREARPGLIDVSLDAYRWTGPWAGRRGFDSLVQMSAGIAHAGMVGLGRPRPTPLPVQALDHAAGYMMAAAVILGLAQGAVTTRVSLARTALLLSSAPPAASGPDIGKPEDADFADESEHTAWGPAQRLRPPAIVGEAAMRWDRPAGHLGSAEAVWQR
jgi:crotonobetainyl-CoA:carnitine CoA-transferase CaiB-like acyl-CoA transferase